MAKTNPIKILLLEDDELIVQNLKKISEETSNYSIDFSTSLSSEAMDYVKKNKPAIIIADLHVTDGMIYDFFKTIKTEFSDSSPYLIAITSFASSTVLKNLKLLVDSIYIKNDFFDPHKIFADLDLVLNFKNAKQPSIDDFNITYEKEIISILEKFTFSVKRGRGVTCATIIINSLLCTPSEDFKLTSLYDLAAKSLNIESYNSVRSLVSRLIADILNRTDEKILKEIFRSSEKIGSPTEKEFFIAVKNEVKKTL